MSGVGGTLSGNALSLAAIRATLGRVLTDDAFDGMTRLAERWAVGVAGVIEQLGLDWTVQRLGCRAEYWFCPPPRNGGEAAAAIDHEIDAYLHLQALNRGVLLTPVPQHGAHEPGDHRGRRRPPHRGVPAERRSSGCGSWGDAPDQGVTIGNPMSKSSSSARSASKAASVAGGRRLARGDQVVERAPTGDERRQRAVVEDDPGVGRRLDVVPAAGGVQRRVLDADRPPFVPVGDRSGRIAAPDRPTPDR